MMPKGQKRSLPHGWQVHQSKTYPDRVFYFNVLTGITTWELPVLLEQKEEDFVLPVGSPTKSVENKRTSFSPRGGNQLNEDPAQCAESMRDPRSYSIPQSESLCITQAIIGNPPPIMKNVSQASIKTGVPRNRISFADSPFASISAVSNPVPLGNKTNVPRNKIQSPISVYSANSPFNVTESSHRPLLEVNSRISSQNVEVRHVTESPALVRSNDSFCNALPLTYSAEATRTAALVNSPPYELSKASKDTMPNSNINKHCIKSPCKPIVEKKCHMKKHSPIKFHDADRRIVVTSDGSKYERVGENSLTKTRVVGKHTADCSSSDPFLPEVSSKIKLASKSLSSVRNCELVTKNNRVGFQNEPVNNSLGKRKSSELLLEMKSVPQGAKKKVKLKRFTSQDVVSINDRKNSNPSSSIASSTTETTQKRNVPSVKAAKTVSCMHSPVTISANISSDTDALGASEEIKADVALSELETPDGSSIQAKGNLKDQKKLFSIQTWIDNLDPQMQSPSPLSHTSTVRSLESNKTSLQGSALSPPVIYDKTISENPSSFASSGKNIPCDSGYLTTSEATVMTGVVNGRYPLSSKATTIIAAGPSKYRGPSEVPNVLLSDEDEVMAEDQRTPQEDKGYEDEVGIVSDMEVDCSATPHAAPEQASPPAIPEQVAGVLGKTSSSNISKSLIKNKESCEAQNLSIIVDTNIFINHVSFLDDLKDDVVPGFGKPTLIVPWVVTQELDHMKADKDHGSKTPVPLATKFKAKKAVKFLYNCYEKNHPRVIGQKPIEVGEVYGNLSIECNDDKVLQCCLQWQHNHENSQVVLLTEDKSLCNKAMVIGIQVFSSCQSLMSDLKIDAKNHRRRYTTSTTFVTPLQTPPLSWQKKTAAFTAPANVTSHRDRKELEKKLVDDTVGSLKSCLRATLGLILESELKAAFSELWEDIALKKPPWSFMDVLECFIKHWIAVFSYILRRSTEDHIKNLFNAFKCNKALDLTARQCLSLLHDATAILEDCQGRSDHAGIVRQCLATIRKLVECCSNFVEGKSPGFPDPSIKKWESQKSPSSESQSCSSKAKLSSGNSLSGKGADHSSNVAKKKKSKKKKSKRRANAGSSENATTDTQVSDSDQAGHSTNGELRTKLNKMRAAKTGIKVPEVSSAAESSPNTDVLPVHTKFQRVWEAVYKCCELINCFCEDPSSIPVGSPDPIVLLATLVPMIENMGLVLVGLLSVSLDQLSSAQKQMRTFCQLLNTLISGLKLQIPDPSVTPNQLEQFFRNSDSRELLKNGAIQLEEMLHQLLTADGKLQTIHGKKVQTTPESKR